MKTSIFKRSLSMLMAVLLCLSAFVSIGTPTAHAANTKAEVFVISFPRDGDANYSGHWGHDALTYNERVDFRQGGLLYEGAHHRQHRGREDDHAD